MMATAVLVAVLCGVGPRRRVWMELRANIINAMNASRQFRVRSQS
jgi:hypothetical protein